MNYFHLLVALLAPALAAAQPAPAAPAASGPSALVITYDSPCGAPGVGKVWSGPRQGQIEPREGKPNYRVNENGYWAVGCQPPAPAPTRDCPEKAVEPWRGENGWRLCTPAKHSVLRPQNVGREWTVYTPAGAATWGSQRWRCERKDDGTADWKLVKSSCYGR